MGFKRKIERSALAFVLFCGGGAIHAAPVHETLIVTRLAEPEDQLVAVSNSGGEPTLDERIARFSTAVSLATAADQQLIDVRCKSADVGSASRAVRMAWEANCRYRRR